MKKRGFLIRFLAFLILFIAVLLVKPSLRAKEPGIQEEYAGSETCMECHEEVGRAFEKTIHGRLAEFELKGYPRGCEACHGPGSAHAEEADPSLIIRLKDLTPTDAGEICMKCHRGGTQMNWQGSAHDLSGVSCTSCHDPHTIARNQLTKRDPELCYSCHASKRAQINYPSHHPIREKKMNCSSCHDSHGGGEGNIKAETLTELCLKCHVEKQGPFTFEHVPVVENCAICHDSHGSIANHLQRQTEPFLCMQCHPGHEDHRHPALSDTTWNVSFFTRCTHCHSRIHGSDFPSLSGRGRFGR
ncbi:MAG: DmsE family decaheme c-type cytochrome [Candidatus Aminicenantes bacterium]|nr:DmsE family decaheme c-type cytochrome [Candidatus Aminicenantes bacterium]